MASEVLIRGESGPISHEPCARPRHWNRLVGRWLLYHFYNPIYYFAVVESLCCLLVLVDCYVFDDRAMVAILKVAPIALLIPCLIVLLSCWHSFVLRHFRVYQLNGVWLYFFLGAEHRVNFSSLTASCNQLLESLGREFGGSLRRPLIIILSDNHEHAPRTFPRIRWGAAFPRADMIWLTVDLLVSPGTRCRPFGTH